MKSDARFRGKRRFAGFLILVAVSISLVGISAGMFTHFADYRKEPKRSITFVPTQTSTASPLRTAQPTKTRLPSSTPISTALPSSTPISTALPSSKVTPISTALPSSNITPTSGTTPSTGVAASPLIFGTNLVLYNGNDQVLTSSSTQSLLQQIHMQMIRMPIRTGVPEAVNVQAAQMIKNLGATPLVILFGAHNPQALASNILVITDMNRVFGNNVVYYEFGNEDDFLKVSAPAYTAAWNANIPALKRAARNGQFIGPVNYHYDPVYLSYFLGHAVPRPDAVSWHEYACWASDTTDVCMAHLTHWTLHIQDARAIISTTGSMLPIMITEWNYDANATLNDGKSTNSTFMRTWTTAALQTLAKNHILASMQYACTNPVMPLITSGGTLTAQGNAFLTSYQQLVLNH